MKSSSSAIYPRYLLPADQHQATSYLYSSECKERQRAGQHRVFFPTCTLRHSSILNQCIMMWLTICLTTTGSVLLRRQVSLSQQILHAQLQPSVSPPILAHTSCMSDKAITSHRRERFVVARWSLWTATPQISRLTTPADRLAYSRTPAYQQRRASTHQDLINN